MKTPAMFSGLATRIDPKTGDCRVTLTFTSMESPAGASMVVQQFAPLTGLEVMLGVTRRQLTLDSQPGSTPKPAVDLDTGEVTP